MPTAIASEMTNAIRDLGSGVETQGRALRSSVRHLGATAGVDESSRARIVKDIQVPTSQVLALIASALRLSSSLLASAAHDEAAGARTKNGYAIVDRRLTRC